MFKRVIKNSYADTNVYSNPYRNSYADSHAFADSVICYPYTEADSYTYSASDRFGNTRQHRSNDRGSRSVRYPERGPADSERVDWLRLRRT